MDLSILSFCREALGFAVGAVPLSVCRPARTRLLGEAGIPQSGTALPFAVPYLMTEDARDRTRNVSLFAVPMDYHRFMRALGASLLARLHAAFPSRRFALFSDHAPIVETDAAARAGLGVVGENGLLITPDYGSFVFLGEVVTDAPFQDAAGQPADPAPDRWASPPRCEGCRACLRACPVGGRGPNCLSRLTQKRQPLTEGEAAALAAHTLVWGCDDCQLACPHNRSVLERGADTPVPFFRTNRVTRLDPEVLEAMPEEEFALRAYAWRGRNVVLRNLRLRASAERSAP